MIALGLFLQRLQPVTSDFLKLETFPIYSPPS